MGKLFRVAKQWRPRPIMDWDHNLWIEKFDGLGCVFWSHNEMFADRQKREVDVDILPDQFHVRKESGITSVEHGFTFYLDNCSGGLTQIDRATVFIRYRRAMNRLRELDGTKRIFAPAPMILGRSLCALRAQPGCQLKG